MKVSAAQKRWPEYRTWLAMKKFVDDQPLTEQEWHDLSALSLVDRRQLFFGPGNCRWARSEAERAENERFYRGLGRPQG